MLLYTYNYFLHGFLCNTFLLQWVCESDSVCIGWLIYKRAIINSKQKVFSGELLSKILFSTGNENCLPKAVILSNTILERYIILQGTLAIKLRKQCYPYNYLIATEKQTYLAVKETLILLQNSYKYFTVT